MTRAQEWQICISHISRPVTRSGSQQLGQSRVLTKPSPSQAAPSARSAGAGGGAMIFSCFSTCLIFITKHQQNSELNTFITCSSSGLICLNDIRVIRGENSQSFLARFENVLNIYSNSWQISFDLCKILDFWSINNGLTCSRPHKETRLKFELCI